MKGFTVKDSLTYYLSLDWTISQT